MEANTTNPKDSETELCDICGERPAKVLETELGDKPYRWVFPCHPCAEKQAAEELLETERRIAGERRDLFERIVPPLYQDSDPRHFPPEWEAIKRWRPKDGKGLIIVGASGKCKTRMAAELLRILLCDEGRRIGFVRASELAKLVREQFQNVESVAVQARERLRDIRTAGILCFDDLGKQANSPTVEEAIYELIEDRTAHKRPMIVTVNAVGDELEQMMSDDRGAPIVRRLREFCEPVIIES